MSGATRDYGGRVWLAAHDFSRAADAAADLALDDLAEMKGGGTIVLLHVYTLLVPGAPLEPHIVDGSVQLEQAVSIESTRSLERVAERLREKNALKDGDVEIEVVARLGAPAETILEEATARGAARIVVGTHGRTGVRHWLLGSVAERVVRLARVPVVVAHQEGT